MLNYHKMLLIMEFIKLFSSTKNFIHIRKCEGYKFYDSLAITRIQDFTVLYEGDNPIFDFETDMNYISSNVRYRRNSILGINLSPDYNTNINVLDTDVSIWGEGSYLQALDEEITDEDTFDKVCFTLSLLHSNENVASIVLAKMIQDTPNLIKGEYRIHRRMFDMDTALLQVIYDATKRL